MKQSETNELAYCFFFWFAFYNSSLCLCITPFFLSFYHLTLFPSPPCSFHCKLPLSLPLPTPPTALSFPSARCSFSNLWISEHHFLDFSTPQGDILIPDVLFFFTSFPPSFVSESQRHVEVPVSDWKGGWLLECVSGRVGGGSWTASFLYKEKRFKVNAIPNLILHMTTRDIVQRLLPFKDPSCRINRAFERLLLLDMNVPHPTRPHAPERYTLWSLYKIPTVWENVTAFAFEGAKTYKRKEDSSSSAPILKLGVTWMKWNSYDLHSLTPTCETITLI